MYNQAFHILMKRSILNIYYIIMSHQMLGFLTDEHTDDISLYPLIVCSIFAIEMILKYHNHVLFHYPAKFGHFCC